MRVSHTGRVGVIIYISDKNHIVRLSANDQALFEDLKILSKEFAVLLRVAPLLSTSQSHLSPLLAQRFEALVSKQEASQAHVLADLIGNMVTFNFDQKLRILSKVDLKQRIETVHAMLLERVQSFKQHLKNAAIATSAISRMPTPESNKGPSTSRFTGLGRPNDENEVDEVDELDHKLRNAHLNKEARQIVTRELRRIRKMNPANAEYAVCRNYLETLAEIPWTKATNDKLGPDSLQLAKKQLDDDHYGLENIKKRLLEYLAVLKLKQSLNADVDAEHEQLTLTVHESKKSAEDTTALENQLQQLEAKRSMDKAPILLFVGPPGTGKTSLARSIATSLGRKFHRVTLGGVRDEAEIRGHRRTYVASMPGLFVNGLRKIGVCNPLFLLDEIDKIGHAGGFHGDPSAAMLEVLDPEQNHAFSDHYVNLPIDLSKVLFIATANTLDTIPPPLLDRMEVVQLSGYTPIAKGHIARSHLIDKQIRMNGLSAGQVDISDEVLGRVISSYTHEAGVRNLERQIGAICRYKAVQFAEAKDFGKMEGYSPKIAIEELETILGLPPLSEEITDGTSNPGTVTGLVAYSGGGQGGILFIEVADMPGTGKVQLTGTLGNVLKESVEVALTWVKAHAFELGLLNDIHQDIMRKRDIHVHCPAGGIPKDGPSAGLAHTIALISLFASKPVSPTLAMTGEVSLRGRVMPVGGIKEKLIGADRAGVKAVLLPEANRKDVVDVPAEVIQNLQIHHVK